MTVSLLSAANWPIVGWLCTILGKVMNFIYNFLDGALATDNGLVGLSIIIYTIIVYMCMLPMTINQQKTSRLTAVMNPEIQAIQKKYKNKKDQASAIKQNEEIQQVYDKYGASMMGGCLPLLIQMPFLFALYPVIYDIQAYVPAIATAPAEVNRFLTIPDLTIAPMEMIKNAGSYGLPSVVIIITAIALPLISAATQVISMKLSQSISGQNNRNSGNDQMESTMKTMNTTMPILSIFMVATLPTGIGVYWIFSAVVRIVQQFFINKHLKKMSIDDLIEKNKEKAAKKAKKRSENSERVNAMAQANTRSINGSAKRTVNDKNSKNSNVKNANVNKPGSLASKANMVKKFNDNK